MKKKNKIWSDQNSRSGAVNVLFFGFFSRVHTKGDRKNNCSLWESVRMKGTVRKGRL